MPRRRVAVRAVRWIPGTASASARRAAAGAVVATLVGRPQMGTDAPAALRSGSNRFDPAAVPPAQNAEPIHYTDLGEAFSSLHPPPKPVHPTPRQAFKSYLARPNNRQKPAPPASTGPRSRSMARRTPRPGTGGRQPRPDRTTPTTATQRLFDELGPPMDTIPGPRGAVTRVWRTADADRPGKKGAVVGRLSSREMQGGETIGGQLHDGYRLAKDNDLVVAYIIASTNFYSELPFEERTDFEVLEELFSGGQCSWVSYREPDRVAREMLTAELFYERVRHFRAELWLADQGRHVDWANDSDVFAVGAKNLIGQMERNRIRARTQDALRRRWVEEGRGWPGALPFGFRRNEQTKFPEIDPEQWPATIFLHESYADATTRPNGRHVGVSALGQKLFERFGFELCDDAIRVMLKNPIYVDGAYTVNCHGHPVACEPIPLGDQAVPLETFQRNQELMAVRRGANNKTPIGTFPLNGLKIIHARCRDERHSKTRRKATMKVRQQRDCPPRLYHDKFTPQCCRGYTLDPDVILAAVIEQLLRLADNPELQRAWALAARPKSVGQAKAYTEAQLTELRAQLTNVQTQRDSLAAEWARDIGTGKRTADIGSYQAVHKALDNEARRLQEELDVAGAREASKPRERRPVRFGASDEELRQALGEVLTLECPGDQTARVRRMAVIEACLSAIEIHDVVSDGAEADSDEAPEVELVLIGHLLPPGEVRNDKTRAGKELPISPLDSARSELEAHIRERDLGDSERDGGQGSEARDHPPSGLDADAEGAPGADSRTSVQSTPYTEVRELLRDNPSSSSRGRTSTRNHVPCWRSSRIRVATSASLKWRPWSDAECVEALHRAARELLTGHRLTRSRLAEIAAGHPPHSFPSAQRLRTAAANEGLTFTRWRDLHLDGVAPDADRDPQTRFRTFSDEECEAALLAVSRELGRNRLVSTQAYTKWAAEAEDRPPLLRMVRAASERGLPFSVWRASLLKDDLCGPSRARAALEVADANVDALAASVGPGSEWARGVCARRQTGDGIGYRYGTDDWLRALGEAAGEHPSMRHVRRCARNLGLEPAELFRRLRAGERLPSLEEPASTASRARARVKMSPAAVSEHEASDSPGPTTQAESEAV